MWITIDAYIEKTKELIINEDVAIATSGASMVKAAYSSGKLAFGVNNEAGKQCIMIVQ
jgi:hypothetical protein